MKVAAKVSPYNGTSITSEFISSRSSSWQGHLERISCYLEGEGIWWSKNDASFVFFDGDVDPDYHSEGPALKHFRSINLKDIAFHSQEAWKKIIQDKVPLPATSMHLYVNMETLLAFKHLIQMIYLKVTNQVTISMPLKVTTYTTEIKPSHYNLYSNRSGFYSKMGNHTSFKFSRRC